MTLHAYVDVYVLCVCIVSHGHDGDYTTLAGPWHKMQDQMSVQCIQFQVHQQFFKNTAFTVLS